MCAAALDNTVEIEHETSALNLGVKATYEDTCAKLKTGGGRLRSPVTERGIPLGDRTGIAGEQVISIVPLDWSEAGETQESPFSGACVEKQVELPCPTSR